MTNIDLSMFSLAGKSALVTGATGAFGRVATLALANAGADVVVTAGHEADLHKVVEEVGKRGRKAVPVVLRPNSVADAETMVKTVVEKFGRLDIAVSALGFNAPAPTVDMTLEQWETIMNANIRACWLVAKAAGTQMIKQGGGGKIVLTSSARGKLGYPAGYAAYCPSKGATDSLIKTLAWEWGKYRINVNGIGPTVFRSPLTGWLFGEDEKAKAARTGILTRLPLGRLGEPEDLAGALLYLVSAASDFCTGQILYVDGGYTSG
jgi:NAD(P)-dependent dehydrogenase (short-subunit alcohol dehydrogenase family)